MLRDLIRNTRSCRRFHEDVIVPKEVLVEFVDLARLAGSARNAQPLKYLVVNEPQKREQVFALLGWAGYLTDWPGPEKGERPAAYIICLLDTRICEEADCDLGIATQNILLAATEKGLAGCRIASVSGKLHEVLGLPDHLRILLVLALGKPKETVVLEECTSNDIRYWRDEEETHHVPKRCLAEILVNPI